MFLEFVSPNHLQHLLSAHVTSGWHEKFWVEYFKIIYRENTAFWEFFCSRIDVFYLAPGCELLKPCCFETAFAKQRLDSIGFCDDKIFFFS